LASKINCGSGPSKANPPNSNARLVEKVTLKRMALTDDKYRAIFDLDLLGLRAAGAAFYDTYEKSREYEVEDDGDNT
jgi:hypothetical protein